MKIGIDIDNTITNTLPILKQYCKKYNEEVVKRNLQMHEEGYASYNLYDWTKEENADFCEKYLEEVVLQAKVKEQAKEVIENLKEEGHSIIIMTSRIKPMFKTPYETTERFLKEKGIRYDTLLVGSLDKNQLCIENGIDIMIEDETHHILPIAKRIPVIVFEEIYNKDCKGNNIIKVTNWNEVYEVIQQMNKIT